jgi:tetratricopeptide (TPR) repeat protein
MFRLLGLHPGPDIATPAAASLVGRRPREAAATLAALAQAHLVDEQVPGRFTFHDLLRAYAAEQAQADDTEAVRQAALQRMFDHYVHSAYAADRILNPHRDPIAETQPQPGVTPETFADHRRAMAWFTAEHPVLLAIVERAAEAGFDTHTWRLAWAVTTFVDRRGHWHDSVTVQYAAMLAAQRLADPGAQANARRGLARPYIQLGRYDEAHEHLRHALDLYGGLGDKAGQGRVHMALAPLLARDGRDDEALSHAEHALEMFRAAGDRIGQADALNAVGWYHAHLGRYLEAIDFCEQALSLIQETGDRDGEAHTWDSLGLAHRHLGHQERAVACYEQATRLWRELGDRYYEAATLVCLGDIHHTGGDVDSAATAWNVALTILDEFGHSDAGQVRVKLTELRRAEARSSAPGQGPEQAPDEA